MISVFSPCHGEHNPYLLEAYSSLVSQTHHDWEWVLAPNNGAVIPEAIKSDSRVRVVPFTGEVKGEDGVPRVGRLKRHCCEQCRGDVYVEFDSDDILLPTCLERIAGEIAAGGQFIYSNSAQFEDETWKPFHYGSQYGWKFRPFEYRGHTLSENRAWAPSPQSMRLIMWAPDHVRAWSRDCYWRTGGHDQNLPCGDDHDIVMRTYLDCGTTGMWHLDECLYLYRERPGKNTCKVHVDAIQGQSWANYHRHFARMMRRWCDDEGLRSVDLGEHKATAPWAESVDLADADIVSDLRERWPFEDGTIGMVRAHHLLEHLPDKNHAMQELYRVMAPGGWVSIEVPSTEGNGAHADPSHVSYWNEASFTYVTEQAKAKFLPEGMQGPRYQQSFKTTFTPQWGKAERIQVAAVHLICLKPPYDERPAGEVLI